MPRVRIFSFFLIAALLLPLVFGGLVHSVVPHSHSDNVMITSDMHSAFRHEEQEVFVFLEFLLSFVFTAVILGFSFTTLNLIGRLIRAQHKISISLQRGVLAYRRFG